MSRAKQFAVDDVLAKAVHRFSTHGYHDTSIRNLEQCMGIHRTSMYGAFGSKRGLFVSALRFHIERYGGALRGGRGTGVVAGSGDRGRVRGSDSRTAASSSEPRSNWRPTTTRSSASWLQSGARSSTCSAR